MSRLHSAVLPPPSGLGGVRLQINRCAFSIGRNCGCVGGAGAGGGGAFPALAARRDVTSRGRKIRWSTFAGTRWGGLTAPTWKQTRTRSGSVFFSSFFALSIKRRALLDPPRFDMAPSSLTGCLAQGMSPWCCFFQVHGPAGSSWDWGWAFLSKDSSFRSRFCSIVFAHQSNSNRELFQPRRTITAPRLRSTFHS